MNDDAGTPEPDERSRPGHRGSAPVTRRTASELARERARLTQKLAHQWASLRDQRQPEPLPVAGGPSNFSRAQVPFGLDLAASWAWRFLVIVAAGYLILRTIGFFSVVTLPLVIAILISALVSPAVTGLVRLRLPRGLATIITVATTLGVVGLLLTFAGQQVVNGFNDLANQVVEGLGEIRRWLRDGPLNASESQINSYIEQAQDAITEATAGDGAVGRVTELGTAVGHVFAGFFIVLFSTYFFLADGERIWSWLVRLAPRAARRHVDESGRVAWVSLTQFVRATVVVALVDAIGIVIVALLLGVPFVLAIGVLVFLGAFVPMVGATVAGIVAVLVALVDQGPITALLMLGGVILVQQIEGHVLQPFLMGRWVSLHPLGVIIAIAGGIIVAGIAGALVAVPLVAAVNAVVQHLASNTDIGDDPVDELAEDYERRGERPHVPADPHNRVGDDPDGGATDG